MPKMLLRFVVAGFLAGVVSATFGPVYAPQPRITVLNGHLYLEVGRKKNITFTTIEGSVRVDGIDLVQAARSAQTASENVKQYKDIFQGSVQKIARFEELLQGETGVISRISFLESGSAAINSSTIPRIQIAGLTLVNRRIANLNRKVNRLLNLLDKDECTSNPCQNGGRCQDMYNHFFCHCSEGWEGPTCGTDVNECSRFAGTDLGCQNGASCVNKPGTYECVCVNSWIGLHCTRKTSDCNTGSNLELCGHGMCVSQSGPVGYKCICDQGWTTDGIKPACTVDVNECTANKPPCSTSPPVPCVNVPGSFYCGSCPQGYTGNGYYCTDIDECADNNGGCSITPQVQCVNTPGSRICGLCPPGFAGNGISCIAQAGGICSTNNGGCHPLAQCRDNSRISSTFVECVCPAGYQGPGIGPFGCIAILVTPSVCNPNPCAHGTCVVDATTGNFTCRCNWRYTGPLCNVRRNPCASNPCKNGGTCTVIYLISYRCTCTSSYSGLNCDYERQGCGGRLTDESGILRYPTSNSSIYGNLISCAWSIETNVTQVLKLAFISFNLEKARECQHDWLQIHDGRNSASRLIGRYCGHDLPNGGTITTTQNVIYIWFRTDSTISGTGFSLNWTSTIPVCGENLEVTSHGTLKSPGFPGNYPSNRDCYWSLEALPGKRINFHFFSLMLQNSTNCTADYLKFYQGLRSSDPVLASYCNTSHPEPLLSSGSEVLVHFHSDASGNYPGFQISYSVTEAIPGCGGVFTMDQGEISSPKVDGHYPVNLVCEYKIRLAEKTRIKLTFLEFALEESEESCIFDSVAIHEGGSSRSPLIGKYCGTSLPSPYMTSGNELFIVFTSDWATTDEGFRIKYETVCGGRFVNPSGVIESPGYPQHYAENKVCIYEIIQPLGTRITMDIVNFDIEQNSSPECFYDYLEIRDGDGENATLVGKYCVETPPNVISTHNYLWLKFVSDSSIGGEGFRANYSTFDVGCGGILKNDLGVIKSHEGSKTYSSDSNCNWVVVAPIGYVIQLTWLSFHLEQSYNCGYDHVSVYDNNTEPGMGGLIGQYCGDGTPPSVMSSSNVVSIMFRSDSTISHGGFMVTYSFVDAENLCGGKYFTNSGMIKSPQFPKRYPANRDCSWTITVKPGSQIMLNITDFDLEGYPNCRYDFLDIHNGATAASPIIGKYCGTTIPRLIPSHANQLFIHFRSDLTKSAPGFKLYWNSAATGCGGVLNSPRGSIISPHYPEPYSRNTECYWRVSVSDGSLVQIVFADLDLEPHVHCHLDYIELFDGRDVSGKSLGKYCSNTHPAYVRSTLNHMLIKFRADISFQGRGFNLQYTTVCQNTVKGFKGVISSPNFPDSYPHDQDCIWTIQVADGNKINITFSHFELERSTSFDNNNCSYDYLEIKSGEENEKYGIYCGDDQPPTMTINSHIAQIHFVSDALLIGTGFRLEWFLEGCGGLMKHPEGTLSTPNYPDAYPAATQCDWVIEVEYGMSIALVIQNLDLEHSEDCSYDYLLIINGPDETYPHFNQLCHSTDKPVIVTSTGNFMFVRFRSDYSFHGKGFIANYTTNTTKCGGKFIAPHGAIHSPNYPKNYDNKDTCEYFIEVSPNHAVELIFEDLDLVSDEGCDKDYIKVYDGPTTSHPVLATLCGSKKPNTTIKSSSNQMLVELRTDSRFAAKGFLANYTTACGVRIEGTASGIIDTFNALVPYQHQENCTWTIVSSDPTQHVSFTLTHVSKTFCSDETKPIRIYNGESADAPLIMETCNVLPTVISDGNALTVVVDRYAIQLTGSYGVLNSQCGGTLTAAEGTIATPKYPSSYPFGIQCEWTIQASPGNLVGIEFKEFDLIESENCVRDYVEVREKTSNGKLIGVYCGGTIPANVSHHESLWILFNSGSSDGVESNPKGFLAEYYLVHGNELAGPSGRVASPLYPQFCSIRGLFAWRITVTFGYKIIVKFLDFYAVSYSDDSCYLNYVQVYDGFDETAPSLGEFCGITIPKPLKSSSNVIYIKFFDESNQDARFLIEWLQVASENKSPTIPPIQVDGCGSDGIFDMTNMHNYTFTSPGFPTGYPPHLNCEWIFSTQPENHLSIDFTVMDLEAQISRCLMDVVQVYTGVDGTTNWKLLETLCLPNTTHMPFIHTSNMLKVVLKTDGYVNETGFSARIYQECGGSIEGPQGRIEIINSSSFFNNEYGEEATCEWNVTVKSGRTIEVKFSRIGITNAESHSCANYILLKNGQYRDSPNLGNGKFCTQEIPEPLQTSGNHLYIKYSGIPKTDGFVLTYREISTTCGGAVRLSKIDNITSISSPNFPNIPPSHTECVWTIIAPPGESLKLDFVDRFDLTVDDDCKEEAVEIRDGGTTYSPLLGRFCSKKPSSQISTDNMMFVKFFTDIDDPKNGFKANITLATCGGTIREKSGDLKSPFFNNRKLFPKNADCTWHIIGPIDHYLKLKFNKIDLGSETSGHNCSDTDHVTIKELDRINKTERIIGCYFGSHMGEEIEVPGNEVIVNFVTKSQRRQFDGFSLHFNASQEACGGRLTTGSGVIESPNYPVMNYHQRECEWVITVPKGRRIKIEFLDFDFDRGIQFYELGMALFNNEEFKSRIATVKPSDTPSIFYSSDNILVVYFWSLRSSAHRGFKLKYSSDEPTVCVGDFDQGSGVITQPPTNMSSYSCTWEHQSRSQLNKTLVLSVVMKVDGDIAPSCKYTNTKLEFTKETGKDVIYSLCKNYLKPVIIRSPYPMTKINFIQSSYHTQTNFTITYSTYDCGGLITNPQGTIQVPGLPLECAWLIRLGEDQRIKLTFESLNLDDNCADSYLTVHNGEFPSSPQIRKYCQKNNPSDSISSQSNQLLIQYHASGSTKSTGFKINYEPVVSGCGGIFHESTNFIQSPSYPSDYASNVECVWEIHASTGYHLALEFTDRFYIEQSQDCSNDFLEVWDLVSVPQETWVSLGRKCGRDTPTPFNSTSNKMKVMFRSNDKISAAGFKARWVRNCGGNFTADQNLRYIVSPGYPEIYSGNLNCVYEISSPNEYVNIVFDDFALEGEFTYCKYDNVTIEYKPQGRHPYVSQRTKIFCGKKIPPPIRFKGSVVVSFKTDSWLHRKGFRFSYTTDNCGVLIDKPTLITSPSTVGRNTDRGLFRGDVDCIWNVTAPKDMFVIARFTAFDIEHHVRCAYDFVEIFDGTKINSTMKLSTLCGNQNHNLPVIKSRGRSMLIRMKTDYSRHYPGFTAAIYFSYGPTVGCGGVVNITTTKTQTVQGPENLPDLECHWEVIGPADHIIQMNVLELNFPSCVGNENSPQGKKNCTCHSFEMRDGAGPFAELMDQFCTGAVPENVFVTSGSSAWIRLFTVGNIPGRAFRLVVSAVPAICGSTTLNVTNAVQKLTSPNFPATYPDNIKCVWNLKTSNVRKKLYLRFKEMDLTEPTDQEIASASCKKDRVEIYDLLGAHVITQGLGSTAIYTGRRITPIYGGHRTPAGLHTFCGAHAVNFDYYTGRPEVTVTFYSGNFPHGKGFELEYQIAGCNRNYTAVQGRILNEEMGTECFISITVPENRTISIYFNSFLIFDARNCETAGVRIYDGPNNSARKIAQLCGYSIPDPVFSTGNKLWIHIYGRVNIFALYDATYTSTEEGQGCGGPIYNYGGIFTSPMYPRNYRKDSLCVWEVTVPENMRVVLKFKTFDLQSLCESDYVEVDTYDAAGSINKHRFCKEQTPAMLISEMSKMTVRHRTSVNNGGTGWVAQFTSVASDTTITW